MYGNKFKEPFFSMCYHAHNVLLNLIASRIIVYVRTIKGFVEI